MNISKSQFFQPFTILYNIPDKIDFNSRGAIKTISSALDNITQTKKNE